MVGSQSSDVLVFYKDNEVVNSGLTQASEDSDASPNIAHDEVSFSIIVLTSNLSMKSTESYYVASETSVMDELAKSMEEQSEFWSEPISEKQTNEQESDGMLVQDGMFDDVDRNDLVVNSTT